MRREPPGSGWLGACLSSAPYARMKQAIAKVVLF